MAQINLNKVFRKINKLGRPFHLEEIIPPERMKSIRQNKKKRKKQTVDLRSNRKEIVKRTEQVLHQLAQMGLFILDGSMWVPTGEPLIGKITFNKKGVGFAALRSGIEVIVPLGKTGGAMPGDRVELHIIDSSEDRLFAEVVGIERRAREEFLVKLIAKKNNYVQGHFADLPFELDAYFYAAEFPKFDPKNAKSSVEFGDWIKVRPIKTVRFDFVQGMEVEPVAHVKSEGHSFDLERVALKHGIPIPFTPEALTELPNYTEVSKKNVDDWKKRKDLRDLYTITIDGETAKDFDDAISIAKERKGYRLWVHIADVGYYVKKDSYLDRDALQRGTSVYLQTEVIPMLPEAISNELCSLKAGVNRLAMTCEMFFTEKDFDEVPKYKFYPSIIKVDKRYTYKSSAETNSDKELKIMKELAAKLKAARSHHKIELERPEVGPVYNDDNEIVGFTSKPLYDTNSTIEEFMLSANICAAHFVKEKKVPALHREHESMEDEKLDTLNTFLQTNGVDIDLRDTSHQEILRSLDKVSGKPLYNIYTYVVLRCFKQAFYSPEGLGHWGLGFDHYAHFTSPIRRYPDLVVHRAIRALCDKKKKPAYEEAQLQLIGELNSDAERRAMAAERDMLKIKACAFMSDVPLGTSFEGIITAIRKRKLFVQLNQPPVEGSVGAEYTTPSGEYYLLDDFTAVIRPGLPILYVGQPLTVYLRGVDDENLQILFDLDPELGGIKTEDTAKKEKPGTAAVKSKAKKEKKPAPRRRGRRR